MMNTADSVSNINHCRSFGAVVGENPRLLILGSMPGGESLRQGQYYAFRANAFWRITGALFGFRPDLPYSERLDALRRGGVALWDVLKECERDGSLDSNIRAPVPNDIARLLADHPSIRQIACNGGTAFRYFGRFVKPQLRAGYRIVRLPSSSPAAARMSFEEKLAVWRRLLLSGE